MHIYHKVRFVFFASLLTLYQQVDVFLLGVKGQPQPCGGAVFARVGDKFYIHGGAIVADNMLNTLWALDLATSWATSHPRWYALPSGSANAYHSAGYSADNKTFIAFGRDTAADPKAIPKSWINIYDITLSRWTLWNSTDLVDSSRRDFTAVTNPSKNEIYIVGGDAGPAGAISSNVFTVYETSSQLLTEITTPMSGPQNISTYGAVWVPRLNKMLVIGGRYQITTPTSLFVYDPDSGAWTTQETTGSFNYNRVSHCAAANADGSLVTVFGGFVNESSKGDPNAYILDTRTWRWRTVPYNGLGRGSAACTIAGDTFILWGGFEESPNTNYAIPQGSPLLLLSLNSQTWHTTYTPSADPIGVTVPSGNDHLSGAVIGGIVAGCVAFLLVIAFALYERRRKSHIPKTDPDMVRPDMREADIGGCQSSNKVDHQSHLEPPQSPISSRHNNLPELTPEALKGHRRSVKGSYDNNFGYSNPTTPTTLQFLNTGDYDEAQFGTGAVPVAAVGVGGAAGRYERASYQSDGISASTYYPPPPPVVSRRPVSSDVEQRPKDPQAIVNHAITTQNEDYYPYNSTTAATSTTAEGGFTAATDQYHDTYGVRKHNLCMSSQAVFSNESPSNPQPQYYDPTLSSPTPPMPKRPVSGPQGGFRAGFTPEYPSLNAPQEILQQYQSFHHFPTSPR